MQNMVGGSVILSLQIHAHCLSIRSNTDSMALDSPSAPGEYMTEWGLMLSTTWVCVAYNPPADSVTAPLQDTQTMS